MSLQPKQRHCLVAIVLAVLISCYAVGLSQATVGVVESLDGHAELIRDGHREALDTGREIREGDRLLTGPASTMIIQLDGHRVRLGPETSMLLAALDRQDWRYRLFLWLGRLWIYVKKAADKVDFSIETPAAMAGVRGTLFSLAVGPDGTTWIGVSEGTVAVRPLDQRSSILLKAGFSTTVQPGRPPTHPRKLKPGEDAGVKGLKKAGKDEDHKKDKDKKDKDDAGDDNGNDGGEDEETS